MAVEQARPTRQADDEEQPRRAQQAARSAAGDRGPAKGSDREESAPAGQDPRQALQEQIGRAIRPVLDELQHQLADAVRQQLEQGLLLARKEIGGGADEASQPPPRQDRGQVEQTPPQPQREGPTEEGGRQLAVSERGAAEQDDATPRSAGILGRAGAVPQATLTRVVSMLRGLLQKVRSLLQAVVSWLRRILDALRDRLVAAVLTLIMATLRDRLDAIVGKLVGWRK